MKHRIVQTKWLSVFVLFQLLGVAPNVLAADVNWSGANLGDWNTDSNWQGGIQPDASSDQAAAINNATTAVLSLGSDTLVTGIKLGQGAGQIGGLRIANGGSLDSIAGTAENGSVQVGVAGQGSLTILGGGTLNGTTLTLGGTVGSSVSLGDTSVLTATLNLTGTGASTLNRTTNITGRFVNFSAAGNLTLGSTSILTGLINHATLHSPLKSTGTATLNGVYKPSFSGVTPVVGNKWTIVDAATIAGSFASVDASAAPALPVGRSYQVITANGGTNGRIAQLSVEETLVLNVDRNFGTVAISNAGTISHTFDGYSILSSRGALTGAWNSLQDQAVAGWVEAAPTATELSELNSQNSSMLAAPGSLPLGTPYQQVIPQFGVDPDHLVFEYRLTNGRIIQSPVNYSGTKVNNDLVINVNSATGAVQLKNDSPYDIFLDGYAVYSPAGTLKPANGQWSSLQDQAVSGWQEADPSATVVSELRSSGPFRLTAGSGYSLGTLFTAAGTQDLRFEFLEQGHAGPTDGTVVYGAFGAVAASTQGVLGDYNNNGTVDAADYVMWRNAQGTNTVLRNDPVGGVIGATQYSLWRTNFGKTAVPGSGAGLVLVPEPASFALLMMAGVVLLVRRDGR